MVMVMVIWGRFLQGGLSHPRRRNRACFSGLQGRLAVTCRRVSSGDLRDGITARELLLLILHRDAISGKCTHSLFEKRCPTQGSAFHRLSEREWGQTTGTSARRGHSLPPRLDIQAADKVATRAGIDYSSTEGGPAIQAGVVLLPWGKVWWCRSPGGWCWKNCSPLDLAQLRWERRHVVPGSHGAKLLIERRQHGIAANRREQDEAVRHLQ